MICTKCFQDWDNHSINSMMKPIGKVQILWLLALTTSKKQRNKSFWSLLFHWLLLNNFHTIMLYISDKTVLYTDLMFPLRWPFLPLETFCCMVQLPKKIMGWSWSVWWSRLTLQQYSTLTTLPWMLLVCPFNVFPCIWYCKYKPTPIPNIENKDTRRIDYSETFLQRPSQNRYFGPCRQVGCFPLRLSCWTH